MQNHTRNKKIFSKKTKGFILGATIATLLV